MPNTGFYIIVGLFALFLTTLAVTAILASHGYDSVDDVLQSIGAEILP